MAGEISESYLSRPFTVGENPGRELVYDVVGTDDETEVQNLIYVNSPPTYLGMIRRSISADPKGAGVWKGYARYSGLSATKEFAFDTTGGTRRITQSLGTVARYAPPYETPPDFGGAINVSEDRVGGTDIVVKSYSWTFTHRWEFASFDELLAYSRIVESLTGKFNAAPFYGWYAGEVLFFGGRGQGDDLTDFPITYLFAASENLFDQSTGGLADPYGDGYVDPSYGAGSGIITGIDKMGWDYLWFRYGEFEDADALSLVKRPTSAHVERVYYPGDFSLLGIGDAP